MIQPSRDAGFRDAHVHLVEHGEHLEMLDLSACGSLNEAIHRLVADADRASEHDPQASSQGWIRAHGYRVEGVAERRYPLRDELDQVATDRPVVVTSFDHHACSTNTAGLSIAGVLAMDSNPTGGVIERASDGSPNGVLLESAASLIWSAEPEETPEDTSRWLLNGVADLRSNGFTEAHEMKARPPMALALKDAIQRGQLDTFKVRAYATPDVFTSVAAVLADVSAVPVGLKLFVDGTVNSKTAWMLDPFLDPIASHPNGIGNYTVEQLAQHLRETRDWGTAQKMPHGAEVAAHAIGDGAVRALLDAYDRIEAEGSGDAGVDLRIEHAQFIAETDIPRFFRRTDGSTRSRPIVASFQPCHLLPDMEAIDRLLGHVAQRAFAVREMIDAAIESDLDPADVIVFGSDTPIVPPSVQDNVQAAVHRRRAGLDPKRAVGSKQAVTQEEALALSMSRAWRGRESK